MFAVKGYYNGKEFVPLNKVDVRQNQKVIITILDEYLDEEILGDKNKKINAIKELEGILRDKGKD